MAGLTLAERSAVLAFTFLAIACGAHAGVTAEEAAALGSTLTAVGAEKAGSADGRIPEYTGGLRALPAGRQAGDTRLVDPFAQEKPLQTLAGADAGGASSQLTAGTLELLRRYPSFRVEVYPTHRTVAYPQFLIDNARRNATDARATDDGLGIENVRAGVPFPIPKNGREVMWNHRLRYQGRAVQFKYDSWLVDATGQRVLTSTAQSLWEFPAFDPQRVSPLQAREPWFMWKVDYTGPQRRAGEALLLIEAVNPVEEPRHTWVYYPGQRRVRSVELADDVPHSSSSGTYTNDDAFVYTGALERFDVKLLGKRELLVPYNTYRLTYHAQPEDLLQPGHLNPQMLRWELHRVWVVEATLRPGQHHVYGRRVFYVDEDSWTALAADEYDLNGQLSRAVFALLTYGYESGTPASFNHVAYDLGTRNYFLAFLPGPYSGLHHVEPLPASQWSPDSIAGSGVR